MTIRIDLNNLTQAHVDECAPKIGECFYTAPCIIGTLIPRHCRNDLAATTIYSLLRQGKVAAPLDQHKEIEQLQKAFDSRNVDALVQLLSPRGLVWREAAQ